MASNIFRMDKKDDDSSYQTTNKTVAGQRRMILQDENPHFFRSASMESALKAITISTTFQSNGKETKPKSIGDDDKKSNGKKTAIVVSTSSSGWARGKLQKLGYYHPIQPSHETFPKAQLEAILARLTECLFDLSCNVTYERDGLEAECLTMEKVEFHVSFFEKDTQTIIVEVQRRAGDSYIFHHDYAQPILAVVRGMMRPNDKERFMTERPTAVYLDRIATSIDEEDIASALEISLRLVASDRLDARQLGLESLVALTDKTATGWSTACTVTRALVVPLDDVSNKLSNVMLAYLLNENETDITYMALKVWANVWQVAALDTETPLESFCDVLCPADVLMRCLMSRIEHFHHQPHEATLALRGLSALCHEIPQLRSYVSWPAVEQANAVASTAALEQAARTFLEGR